MAQQSRVIVAAIRSFTERQMKAVTLEVHANLTDDTPRDTGWAAANWVPRINTPAPFAENTGNAEAATAEAAAGIASVLSSYQITKGPIYIGNGVPYLPALNAGHSQQAGAHFVERAAERAVHTVAGS